jgi:hypothetical protein
MNSQSIRRLIAAFEEIEAIMEREHGENWIIGIRSIIEKLRIAEKDAACRDEAVKTCLEQYLLMLRVPNGFADYFVWRDDVDSRNKANIRLDELKAEVRRLLFAESPTM